MARYGLIGYPLGHSLSASYFSDKFSREGIDASYTPHEIDSIEKVRDIMTELDGFNVTIPYKSSVIPFLDTVSSEASEINAVNCVKITPDGISKGFNTDVYGIRRTLHGIGLNAGERALILGTGGAAKAVRYVLEEMGLRCMNVSRSDKGDLQYGDLDKDTMEGSRLIVNATPCGMYPASAMPDIPYRFLGSRNTLFDLVYNPEITLFLEEGRRRGTGILTGMTMFRSQAEESWRIWNDPDI